MATKQAPNPIATAEAELANLAARRETLAERRTAAVAALDEARVARKAVLASDPAAELTTLTRTVRDGEDEVSTLDGVLVDLDEQVADAERRLTEARDRDERATAATALQTIASAVDDAAARLEQALATVGTAYADLVAEIPTQIEIVRLGDRPTEATQLARAILAEGLAAVCPGAFVTRSDGIFAHSELTRASHLHGAAPSGRFGERKDADTITDAEDAARGLVSDRLRARAAAVLEGKASPNLSDREAPRALSTVISLPAPERNAA